MGDVPAITRHLTSPSLKQGPGNPGGHLSRMRPSDAQPEPVCLPPTHAGWRSGQLLLGGHHCQGARSLIMRLLRGLLGVLLWILASLLGLVGLVLCVTIVLLPLGIPVVAFAGRLITRAVQLMLPRSAAHPVKEVKKTTKKERRKVSSAVSDAAGDVAKKGRKVWRQERKRL